jgi:hypothetical protein
MSLLEVIPGESRPCAIKRPSNRPWQLRRSFCATQHDTVQRLRRNLLVTAGIIELLPTAPTRNIPEMCRLLAMRTRERAT